MVNAPPVQIEPLKCEHLADLATVLLHPAVYEHIEPELPTLSEFTLALATAINGPFREGELWLNYLVRTAAGGEIVGRVEATLHSNLAEIAFLLAPDYWGKGYGSSALAKLHKEVLANHSIDAFWATTSAGNVRSQALLERSGYSRVEHGWPSLLTYEPGDLVFARAARPNNSSKPTPLRGAA